MSRRTGKPLSGISGPDLAASRSAPYPLLRIKINHDNTPRLIENIPTSPRRVTTHSSFHLGTVSPSLHYHPFHSFFFALTLAQLYRIPWRSCTFRNTWHSIEINSLAILRVYSTSGHYSIENLFGHLSYSPWVMSASLVVISTENSKESRNWRGFSTRLKRN